MVPSYFTVLDDFPYTPNGKINKKALPIPKEILFNSDEKGMPLIRIRDVLRGFTETYTTVTSLPTNP